MSLQYSILWEQFLTQDVVDDMVINIHLILFYFFLFIEHIVHLLSSPTRCY